MHLLPIDVMTGFASSSFAERWHQLTLMEQLGNIGSEADRAINWRARKNIDLSTKSLYRTLELLDLTIADTRWRGGKRKELTRVREVLCDMFVGDNVFNTTPESLSRYFYQFAFAAQRAKETQQKDNPASPVVNTP